MGTGFRKWLFFIWKKPTMNIFCGDRWRICLYKSKPCFYKFTGRLAFFNEISNGLVRHICSAAIIILCYFFQLCFELGIDAMGKRNSWHSSHNLRGYLQCYTLCSFDVGMSKPSYLAQDYEVDYSSSELETKVKLDWVLNSVKRFTDNVRNSV